MAIHVALNHKTIYRYDRRVAMGPQTVRLRPAPHSRTPVLAYSMKVTPAEHFCNWQQDPQSNHLARLVFPEKTREFTVEVDLIVDMTVINPFDYFLEPEATEYPFTYARSLNHEIAPFLHKEPASAAMKAYLAGIDERPRPMNDFLVDLNQRVKQDVRYVIRMEPGVQTADKTLECRSGSCRDSAWLLVQILRHLGIAARFVSGYLIQLAEDIQKLDFPAGPDHDFTDLHAWVEAYLPGAGWVGLDPTSGLFASEGHIPLACSPDPQSAAPISGAVDDCEVDFSHHMGMKRLFEDPRVTKPYTDDQWEAIEALGHRIDEDLVAGDVRLTMGGEPTFVSIDDMDGAEWNIAALGKHKRDRAGVLIHRLRKRFAPRGLLHIGQGKQYPGELLPRWSLSCHWRTDGEPIWRDDRLIADGSASYGLGTDDATKFTRRLAERLEVDPDLAIPGYEDVWYYLWKERRLPANVDPFDSKLERPEDRARVARVFEQGLEHMVGLALPLRRAFGATHGGWISGPWFLRAERMYLLPGDSPMGLRLPLESLPWLAPEERRHVVAADPFDPRPPMRSTAARVRQLAGAGTRSGDADAWRHAEAAGTGYSPEDPHVRTALCVEVRDGCLCVFMPPVERAEDYLDLVTAVEDTAQALDVPVMVEGYEPPRDARLNHIRVTPDPGVIEVNVHPAHSWEELVHNTTTLYEEARASRLGTEKFMLDGRHTGTGGGNHVVIGGPTPPDSPILRRPDLLRSLMGYWHNHPSLSYLFSGMFVGPTSQAPRAEESRVDAAYELEIAFSQVPQDTPCAPWLVDRIFRNLLVDVTGNTHRSEFCIDKLYSPDSATGRLGLVEFRAFEMPPHARMSLTQQLLLRALIARFWDTPYNEPLSQWGSRLYDEFALPHFVRQDFEDVIDDLGESYPIEAAWFAPHFEFRFPRFGSIDRRGVHLELRQAIEPWDVLGEESRPDGNARYVDSSIERVQVKVTGLNDVRHVVTCNGYQLPLAFTGTNGEYVAGVRYRAWQPPSCLHPTIPVHAPLVLDIVDTWLGRSIGGCTYHVSHPGGRSHEQFPVNADEAEARRNARFFPINHTPGGVTPKTPPRHPRYPMTLDLRRVPAR